jgi:hypothetical protein
MSDRRPGSVCVPSSFDPGSGGASGAWQGFFGALLFKRVTGPVVFYSVLFRAVRKAICYGYHFTF